MWNAARAAPLLFWLALMIMSTGCDGKASRNVGDAEEAAATSPSAVADPVKERSTVPTRSKSAKRHSRRSKSPYREVRVKSGGSVRGTIKLASTPELPAIRIDRDAFNCGSDARPSERAVFDAKNLTLANCFVRLINVESGKAWPESLNRVTILDQKQCQYVPHITVVRAGKKLKVTTSDTAEHRPHLYYAQDDSTKWGFGGPKRPDFDGLHTSGAVLAKPGKIFVKCDIHPWMNAFVHVVDHPYCDVTSIDGKFSLEDVPPGMYMLEVWHESLVETPTMGPGGKITGYTFDEDWVESREIRVKAGGAHTADFEMPIVN